MGTLPPSRFKGLPAGGFAVFSTRDRDERRRAIIAAFHPPLADLASDLLERLGPAARAALHAHLPRLDWPRGYQPFCTWVAISQRSHGYQAGPQLNVGVHADHVAIRLGWDTQAADFGRFEFLSRHGGVGTAMVEVASREDLAFRVYASARWPEGSRRVFESSSDWAGAFAEVRRHGVWFELGARHDLPASLPLVTSPALGEEAARVLGALLPICERAAGLGLDSATR